MGFALLTLSMYLLVESRRLPFGGSARPGPGFFPILVGVALGLVGLGLVVVPEKAPGIGTLTWPEKKHAAAIVLCSIFAALAMPHLGYRLTMLVVLVYLLGILERQHPVAVVLLALLGALGTFWMFNALGVQLPTSPWGF